MIVDIEGSEMQDYIAKSGVGLTQDLLYYR